MSRRTAHEAYVEAIGEEAAARLFLTVGGAGVYLAENPGLECMLVKAVGLEAARALARHFGRGTIEVPTAKRWVARHLSATGLGVAEIARVLHVTQPAVRGYLKGGSKHPDSEARRRQMSLFGD